MKAFLGRDMIRLVMRHAYPFQFETWWLCNERKLALAQFTKNVAASTLLAQLLQNTTGATTNIGHIPSFLDQYRHEAGSYYTDTYNCAFYYSNDGNVCDCGECGGTMIAFWCDYKLFKSGWCFDLHMDEDRRMSAVEVSNAYAEEHDAYNQRIQRRTISLQQRKRPLIKY